MNAHQIVIKGARANNLNGFSLNIPHHQLIVVTGVSGSGKSSLAFDIIAREGQRRYFETLPAFAKLYAGKLNQPEVDSIEGISPVIAIGQKTTGVNARSTVGTMSDIYDLFRLLYARFGEAPDDVKLSRSLFSFNTNEGRCPQCNGIGEEEKIDIDKLVADPNKTLREGALAPTLPTGYIMYSQVTIDVLNQVCEAEGFDVNIPWNELSKDQQNVILYGSEKIKVPFGKHSIESRLKWTGIKAKPREEGYYKGMLPIMSDILRRDRNANILKYVSSVTCNKCNGDRLNEKALSVVLNGASIASVAKYTVEEVQAWLEEGDWNKNATSLINKIKEKTDLLSDLGLGHLTIDRPASQLTASEAQRIRVANQLTAPLSDVLYVLDEPSIGLHPEENIRMIKHLKGLVNKGNTVIVVEHDLDTIRSADWIIDIGPKSGKSGGQLLFNGPLAEFKANEGLAEVSATYRSITSIEEVTHKPAENRGKIELFDCRQDNLKGIDIEFQLGQLNIVSGKSGSGTKALVLDTLRALVESSEAKQTLSYVSKATGLDQIDKCIFVDQSPIGRTPRSNPATYIGISDAIRDLYASLPEAKEKGFSKSRFSFNNKGGRCETCQGAGKIQIGMHFLGNVDLICGTCAGDRFNEDTLQVKFREKSIAEIYKLSVNDALAFFEENSKGPIAKLRKGLITLKEIGLGYLTLGQSSTTLSGGEAQRIKIANQLQKKESGNTMYILVEPSIGLHNSDLQSLVRMFDHLTGRGNTVVCIEQDEQIISAADWHIELGPNGGKQGGELMYQGRPTSNRAIREPKLGFKKSPLESIELRGVTTNALKSVDVSIPKNQLTVVTGRSGSGKSSLVYDTLFAEANARFSESLSTYNRTFVQQNSTAEFTSSEGLTPAIALRRTKGTASRRSTVGTLSGVYDSLRLLYARITTERTGISHSAQHFSFNHHLGACESCSGDGVLLKCDRDSIIVDEKESIFNGALSSNKVLRYYSNPDGQFMAILRSVAASYDWDLNLPWKELSLECQNVILYGTGEEVWKAEWEFKTKTRTGVQEVNDVWMGLCNYIDDEYERKIHNKNIDNLKALLGEVRCEGCKGSRLKSELLETSIQGKNIHEFSQLSIAEALEFLKTLPEPHDKLEQRIIHSVVPGIERMLKTLQSLGLDYLSLNRAVRTISGGERQRIMLAGQLASHLHGVTYVLDEPTIGLDRQQIGTLVKLLRSVVEKGNTVVVVEHDPGFIRNADYLIELGPGAGKNGGEIIYQGKPDSELKPDFAMEIDKPSVTPESTFGVQKAFLHNLKQVDVSFNSNEITVVTGVSGSGKTTLIRDVLFASYQRKRPIGCQNTFGLDQFEEIVFIDQAPFALNRLNTPATYTGLLDQLKLLFAKTEGAVSSGLKRADFSYLSKVGKCKACNGQGKQKVSLDFMSDVWSHCESCNGSRYSDEVNEARLFGYAIGEFMHFTLDELSEVVQEKKIITTLKVLQQLGLGHIQLGQAGNTLSGGEAQRLKIAKHLMTKSNGNRLFLIDEPSTGLHQKDLTNLIQQFYGMIRKGDTMVFIEHNNLMVQAAHSVVELGPGSGEQGGRLI